MYLSAFLILLCSVKLNLQSPHSSQKHTPMQDLPDTLYRGTAPKYPHCFSVSEPQIDSTYNPNRKVIKPPYLNASPNEQGRIAIDIWVGEYGDVIQARFNESKSTSGSEYLIGLAIDAAKTIKYETKLGAIKEYVGYEIFEFTKI